MGAEGLHSPKTTREPVDRRSGDYYLNLKEKLVDDIGIKDEYTLSNTIRELSEELNKVHSIDNTLAARHKNVITRLQNALAKKSDRPRDDKYIPKFADQYTDNALAVWKEKTLATIAALETHKEMVDVFADIELDPLIHELLSKYAKEHVSELLSADVPLAESELQVLSFMLRETMEFRNRKIHEFIAYRYARKFPRDGDVGVFLEDAHAIVKGGSVADKNAAYRQHNLSGSVESIIPTFLLTDAMDVFKASLEKEESDAKDSDAIQKRALKDYLLFELIHPYSDGNGRTGRALFMYLQRRYADVATPKAELVHIPVARHETNTVRVSAEGSRVHTTPGSLSVDIQMLVSEILHTPQLEELPVAFRSSLAEAQPFSTEESQKTFMHNLIQDALHQVRDIFDSEEVAPKLEKLRTMIVTQSAHDLEVDTDWKMIGEAYKEELNARR